MAPMPADFGQHCFKVLLIDPNEADRQSFENHLRLISDEYVVLTVSSGKAGLELCQSEHFDCVVTELNLSDTSGFGVLCSLVPLVTQPQVAVIALTRHFSTLYAELAVCYGAQACLSKPHTSGVDLDNAIRNAIAVVARTKSVC